MKNFVGILSILSILTILTIGIVAAETNTDSNQTKANGTILYNYITNESDYKTWQMWPGKDEFYPGKEPHGSLLTTYVTDDTFSAIESGTGELPDGSIIVKENYMPDKSLAAITVMYKEAGYDPSHNDWFWAKYLPDGKIDAEGKVTGCIGCHSQPKTAYDNQINDYIFTSNLKLAPTTSEPTIVETTTVEETETVEETNPPTADETTPPTPVPTKSPGFEGIVGLIGIISVIYLFRKNR